MMLFLEILIGIFVFPFVMVLVYNVLKVCIDVLLTLYGDALSVMGYHELRDYNKFR